MCASCRSAWQPASWCCWAVLVWTWGGWAVCNWPPHGCAAARACRRRSHTNASCFVLALSVPLLQFERERSRALSKDLLAARQRWQATEAERAATEDARR